MATKKDLVEAYSFSRRRLVTAFLSGAPGGREVEPARPMRTVVGGLALAILLAAGAAIASVLDARTDDNWNQVGLISERQTGVEFVILKQATHPTLIPIANFTSAQLILGASITPTTVDQGIIEKQTPGTAIGILGAPPALPVPRQFIEQGWTSCTDDGLGMTLDLSDTEKVASESGHAAVVYTDQPGAGRTYYLIAESSAADADDRRAYAYQMPHTGRLDQTLRDVGLAAQANAVKVPAAWVRLFPSGGSLTSASFPISGFGQAPPPAVARYLPAGATIGQYYESGSQAIVVTAAGSVELDPFSLAVYKQTVWNRSTGHRGQAPTPLPAAPDPQLPGAKQIFADAHWPATTLAPVNGQVCAQLDLHAGREPAVALRGDPDPSVAAPASSSTDDAPVFSIDDGGAAYVMLGDWDETTSGSRAVVDSRGEIYPLLGADTVAKLGYGSVSPPLVPTSWTDLLAPGVALSTNAALCPPVLAPASDGSASAGTPTAPATPSAAASTSTAAGGTEPGEAPDCQTSPS